MYLYMPRSECILPTSLKHSSPPNCKTIKEHTINYLNEMTKNISICKSLAIIKEN